MPSKDYYSANKEKYRRESLEYYFKHKNERDEINKIWAKNNPEKVKIIKNRYAEKNKEEIKSNNINYYKTHRSEYLERAKIWYKNNPEKIKNRKLAHNYGITYDDYKRFLQDQNNKCGVCSVDLDDTHKLGLRSPCVDHNHFHKKEVRGILCRGCNSGIGLFDDNPILLEAALLWLKKKEYDIRFDKTWHTKKKIKDPLYKFISDDQSGKCGICQKELLNARTNLDHNHFSMKVRGLLCAKCNKALGFLKDDSVIINNAINWLKKGEL
jgi:Recombination endonuclease VII